MKKMNSNEIKAYEIGLAKARYEHMKKYSVPAKDPVDFLEKYTRQGYGIERGKEYQESRIESAYEDLEKFGYCMLPNSSSKTGEIVTWYPKS